jgi:hypothetical protein
MWSASLDARTRTCWPPPLPAMKMGCTNAARLPSSTLRSCRCGTRARRPPPHDTHGSELGVRAAVCVGACATESHDAAFFTRARAHCAAPHLHTVFQVIAVAKHVKAHVALQQHAVGGVDGDAAPVGPAAPRRREAAGSGVRARAARRAVSGGGRACRSPRHAPLQAPAAGQGSVCAGAPPRARRQPGRGGVGAALTSTRRRS